MQGLHWDDVNPINNKSTRHLIYFSRLRPKLMFCTMEMDMRLVHYNQWGVLKDINLICQDFF